MLWELHLKNQTRFEILLVTLAIQNPDGTCDTMEEPPGVVLGGHSVMSAELVSGDAPAQVVEAAGSLQKSLWPFKLSVAMLRDLARIPMTV